MAAVTADTDVAAILAAYDFSAASSIVDVGGGNGALLSAILEVYPRPQGRILDQPHAPGNAPAVFQPIDRIHRVQPMRLSENAVALIVKLRAKAVGLDPKRYAGLSLRAGLATSAAATGLRSG